MKAIWNNQIIAESYKTINIEGNQYFPVDSVKSEFLEDSDTQTHCHWKGDASYKTIVVDGKTNKDAAWYYPSPMERAKMIKGYFAFWKGVKIEK